MARLNATGKALGSESTANQTMKTQTDTPTETTELKPNAPEQDALLTPEQCSSWLGIAERTLLSNVRRKRIPAVRINARVIRFHKATVLAALQK